MSISYTVGQKLIWSRDNNFSEPEIVEVLELRRNGRAKLSNGWLVDEDGVAEGTNRIQGGMVWECVAGQELMDRVPNGVLAYVKH